VDFVNDILIVAFIIQLVYFSVEALQCQIELIWWSDDYFSNNTYFITQYFMRYNTSQVETVHVSRIWYDGKLLPSANWLNLCWRP